METFRVLEINLLSEEMKISTNSTKFRFKMIFQKQIFNYFFSLF